MHGTFFERASPGDANLRARMMAAVRWLSVRRFVGPAHWPAVARLAFAAVLAVAAATLSALAVRAGIVGPWWWCGSLGIGAGLVATAASMLLSYPLPAAVEGWLKRLAPAGSAGFGGTGPFRILARQLVQAAMRGGVAALLAWGLPWGGPVDAAGIALAAVIVLFIAAYGFGPGLLVANTVLVAFFGLAAVLIGADLTVPADRRAFEVAWRTGLALPWSAVTPLATLAVGILAALLAGPYLRIRLAAARARRVARDVEDATLARRRQLMAGRSVPMPVVAGGTTTPEAGYEAAAVGFRRSFGGTGLVADDRDDVVEDAAGMAGTPLEAIAATPAPVVADRLAGAFGAASSAAAGKVAPPSAPGLPPEWPRWTVLAAALDDYQRDFEALMALNRRFAAGEADGFLEDVGAVSLMLAQADQALAIETELLRLDVGRLAQWHSEPMVRRLLEARDRAVRGDRAQSAEEQDADAKMLAAGRAVMGDLASQPPRANPGAAKATAAAGAAGAADSADRADASGASGSAGGDGGDRAGEDAGPADGRARGVDADPVAMTGAKNGEGQANALPVQRRAFSSRPLAPAADDDANDPFGPIQADKAAGGAFGGAGTTERVDERSAEEGAGERVTDTSTASAEGVASGRDDGDDAERDGALALLPGAAPTEGSGPERSGTPIARPGASPAARSSDSRLASPVSEGSPRSENALASDPVVLKALLLEVLVTRASGGLDDGRVAALAAAMGPRFGDPGGWSELLSFMPLAEIAEHCRAVNRFDEERQLSADIAAMLAEADMVALRRRLEALPEAYLCTAVRPGLVQLVVEAMVGLGLAVGDEGAALLARLFGVPSVLVGLLHQDWRGCAAQRMREIEAATARPAADTLLAVLASVLRARDVLTRFEAALAGVAPASLAGLLHLMRLAGLAPVEDVDGRNPADLVASARQLLDRDAEMVTSRLRELPGSGAQLAAAAAAMVSAAMPSGSMSSGSMSSVSMSSASLPSATVGVSGVVAAGAIRGTAGSVVETRPAGRQRPSVGMPSPGVPRGRSAEGAVVAAPASEMSMSRIDASLRMMLGLMGEWEDCRKTLVPDADGAAEMDIVQIDKRCWGTLRIMPVERSAVIDNGRLVFVGPGNRRDVIDWRRLFSGVLGVAHPDDGLKEGRGFFVLIMNATPEVLETAVMELGRLYSNRPGRIALMRPEDIQTPPHGQAPLAEFLCEVLKKFAD